MEDRIREIMKRAFFDSLEMDLEKDPPDFEHLRILLDECIQTLCAMVPRRQDIHELIKKDLGVDISWDFQVKLLQWLIKFQPPEYDHEVKMWIKMSPKPLREFIPRFHEHCDKIFKCMIELNKPKVVTGTNGVPDNMKTGRG